MTDSVNQANPPAKEKGVGAWFVLYTQFWTALPERIFRSSAFKSEILAGRPAKEGGEQAHGTLFLGSIPVRNRGLFFSGCDDLEALNNGSLVVSMLEDREQAWSGIDAQVWRDEAGVELFRVRMRDYHSIDSENRERVRDAIDKIDKTIRQGKDVFLHCRAGVGRSWVVTMCYLMVHVGLTYYQAEWLVKIKRPQVNPNSKQCQAVKDFVVWYKDEQLKQSAPDMPQSLREAMAQAEDLLPADTSDLAVSQYVRSVWINNHSETLRAFKDDEGTRVMNFMARFKSLSSNFQELVEINQIANAASREIDLFIGISSDEREKVFLLSSKERLAEIKGEIQKEARNGGEALGVDSLDDLKKKMESWADDSLSNAKELNNSFMVRLFSDILDRLRLTFNRHRNLSASGKMRYILSSCRLDSIQSETPSPAGRTVR